MENEENNNNVDFHLILNQIPTHISKKIFNPPRAESEQEKNLINVIRNLSKLDFDDLWCIQHAL
mgnify:CR=1 FL=1